MKTDATEFSPYVKNIIEKHHKNKLLAYYFSTFEKDFSMESSTFDQELSGVEPQFIKSFLLNQKPVDEILQKMLDL